MHKPGDHNDFLETVVQRRSQRASAALNRRRYPLELSTLFPSVVDFFNRNLWPLTAADFVTPCYAILYFLTAADGTSLEL
jgi:hypothetical protein